MASLLLNAFMTKLILAGISSSRVKFWQRKDDILLIRHRIWSKQSRFKWKKLVTLVFAWSFLASKVPDWSVFVWACSWLVSFFSACSLLVSFRQWLVCFRLCLFLIGPFFVCACSWLVELCVACLGPEQKVLAACAGYKWVDELALDLSEAAHRWEELLGQGQVRRDSLQTNNSLFCWKS